MSKISNFLSTALIILVFISVAPELISKIKKNYQKSLKTHVSVASIKVNNQIEKSIDDYSKQLNTHFKDNSIKAILLEIECPGGSAGLCQAIFNEIQSLKKEYPKPIITLTNNCCASGGYYIASATDYIVAAPSAMIGSIGVVIGYFNVHNILKKYNVNYIDKHSGIYKTAGSPFLPNNPEQENMLQELSDNIYKQFTTDIATNRRLSLKDVDKWANGRIFTGEQALKLGLVDENGCKYHAIKKIRELALIKEEEEIDWIIEENSSNFISMLCKNFNSNLDQTINSDQFTTDLIEKAINKLESRFISCN